MFSTHPHDENRIEHFSQVAKDKGWQEVGALTPLPDFFQHALKPEISDLEEK
jgi:hypothetical protein